MDGDDLSPRILLVVNPASGRGRAGRMATEVAARLRRGATVRVETAADAAGSQRLLDEGVQRHAAGSLDAVCVLGGDGMVHLAAQALAQTGTPLGVVPAGTGNDLAGSLGYPEAPLDAAETLLDALDAGAVRHIDLGRVERSGRWWTTVLCAGFDSAVAERANTLRWPAGPRRYDVAIASELARLRPRAFLLQLDGRYLDGPATLVAIGNAPRYGGGKLIAPAARLDDGRFHVTVVGPIGRTALARMAPTVTRGGHLGHPAVRTYTATTVQIDAADTLAYADGERLGPLPLRTSCIPGALRVLVPPENAAAGPDG